MEDWGEAVFQIIAGAKDKPVSLADIYHALGAHPLVTPYHRQPWTAGGQPRFQCWARRCLTNLVRENRIRRVARGQYSI